MTERIIPTPYLFGDLLTEEMKLDISMKLAWQLNKYLESKRGERMANGDSLILTLELRIDISGGEAIPEFEPA